MERNLAWRKRVIADAKADPEYAADICRMCAQDVLFFINGFVWICEPRSKDLQEIPFLTYPFQDPAILELDECIGNEDLLWEKSRCLGASWMGMTVFHRRWLFFRLQKFLIASSKEDLVDKRDDPDSLFGKIDFINARLPNFMRPNLDLRTDRTHMRLFNPQTKSAIFGAATTGGLARGGRKLAVWIDEYGNYAINQGWEANAALVTVSHSVIFNSTHHGTAGAFYAKSQSKIRKRRMHWTEHPEQAAGLYTYVDGELRILDKGYEFPPDYEFIPTDPHGEAVNGKPRSPYYDAKCAFLILPVLIAQELDINPEGSAEQWFPQSLVSRCKLKCRPPDSVGEMDYDVDTGEPEGYVPQEKGRLWLWLALAQREHDESGMAKPPVGGTYILAADIAAGTGASNSAVVVWDKKTGTKVAEYANPFIDPTLFAGYCYSLYCLFGKPLTVWDATGGLGKLFGKAFLDLGATNVFCRQKETSLGKKQTDEPGFVFAPNVKAMVFGRYRNALAREKMTNLSERALDECRHFVYAGNTVEHSGSLSTVDETGARHNHGDLATADVLACHLMTEQPYHEPKPEELPPPENSLAGRRRFHKRRQAATLQASEGWLS